jgi:hypothetical protein
VDGEVRFSRGSQAVCRAHEVPVLTCGWRWPGRASTRRWCSTSPSTCGRSDNVARALAGTLRALPCRPVRIQRARRNGHG